MSIRDPGITYEELKRIVPADQIEPFYDLEPSPAGAWAVEPAATVELIELLKWANSCHAAVFTRRTRRGDGERFATRPRIYLRSRRMRRVVDLDILSGTITVQTGITMADLQRELEERNLALGYPTRPWRQEPLGAVLAAALDAHWGPRYGAMESEVLNLGVVYADGSVAHSRGSPRKAVGPDFDRLFLGSRGRFGIIHEATLRVYRQGGRSLYSYGAPNLEQALKAVCQAMELGLETRAVEILTPTPDRAWGRKRIGLSEDLPLLVLVEPKPSIAHRGQAWDVLDSLLTPLEPPIGWSIHEGLLPPPRAWTSPVVPTPMSELFALAKHLGTTTPPGLWIVRMSRQGGHLSLAQGASKDAPGVEPVLALVDQHVQASRSHDALWQPYQQALLRHLDPKGILNPHA